MLKHQKQIDAFYEWKKLRATKATQSYFELPEDDEVNFDEELDTYSELIFKDL